MGAQQKDMHMFLAFFARVCVHRSLLSYQLMFFYIDPSFRCRDICKIKMMFFIIDFQIFHISAIMHLQSLQRWIID